MKKHPQGLEKTSSQKCAIFQIDLTIYALTPSGKHIFPSLVTYPQAKLTRHPSSTHLGLTHNQLNLEEPYIQGIKVQVTTKDIKKEDRVCMKSPTSEAQFAECVFQIQPSICAVNFSNNISRSFYEFPIKANFLKLLSCAFYSFSQD